MNAWMNEWMNEWMHEWMNEWKHERMHEPKVIRAPLFFTRDFSNLNSRIPDLLRLQLRDDLAWWCGWHHGDITMMWLTFETGLSLQSCAPFADLIFQKCSKPESFLTCSSGNRSLAIVSCAFSRPHLPKMLRTRQLLHFHQVEIELSIQSRDMLSIVQKFSKPDNEGFVPENVFKIFQAWIHAFPISHASQLLLTWWCGCHDDCGDDVVAITVRKLAMTIVRNSEVS
jgi:hypothetical protein